MKRIFRNLILFALVLATLYVFAACNSAEDNCEHSFVEINRKEYCDKDGVLYLQCAKCGRLSEEKLDPIGHDEVIINAVDATCTENGSTEGKICGRCGMQTITPEEIVARHQIEIIPAKAETCTENGLTEGKFCPVCNTVIEAQQTILAEHKFEIISAIKPTCTEDGRTEGESCVRCGLVTKESHKISASHTIEFVEVLAETCTTDGHTAGYICIDCNLAISGIEVIPAAHKSVIVPGKEGYAATCTSTGISPEMVCINCHATTSTQKEIPMAEHSYEIIVGYAATCFSEGLTDGYRCTVCEYIGSEQRIIPILSHVSATVSGYAAGCTTAGLSEGEKCQLCDCVIKVQNSIAPKGHSFGEDGTCAVCGISVTAELIYEAIGDGKCIVAGLTVGSVPTVIFIPDNYNGASVVGIKDGAFDGAVGVDRVIISKTVEHIGDNAFNGCTNLKVIEISDVSQIKDLGNEWYKNLSADLKIIASFNNGKTPYELYVEAMSAIGNSYTLSSVFNTYITREGELSIMLSRITHTQVNGQDFLEWTEETDYISISASSQLSNGYVDGYLYYQDSRYGLCKTVLSYVDWIDLFGTRSINDTTVRINPEDFKSAVFYLNMSGEIRLSLDLSADRFREIVLDMMPDADIGGAILENCEFEYIFDENGNILSYGFSTIKNGVFKIEGICEISNINSTTVDGNHPILRDAILL